MSKLNCPDFILTEKLTVEQLDFFKKNGFIHFRNFISKERVDLFISEINRIEKQWLEEGVDKINGIPLKFGKDEKDKTIIQRFCFLSQYSSALHDFLHEPRLNAVTEFLSPFEGRIAELEKDGLILNSYIRTPHSKFTQMGWHTDSPRDIFMGQKIMPC